MPLQIKTLFISSYTFIYKGKRTINAGPIVPLIKYFKNKAERIYALEQPLPTSDFLDTQLTVFERGEIVEISKKNFFFAQIPRQKQNSFKTYFRLKLRDICANFYFFLKKYKEFKKKEVDLFIGLECINAICGIILKKLGYTKTVVYYIFDWTPWRYQNPIMNKLYLFLDKIATYYSDYTWNISYKIEEAKKDILNYNPRKMSPQLYVPYSIDYDASKILNDDQIDPDLVIYCGGLARANGVFVLLDAFEMVIPKFPSAHLLIIGGGNEEKMLKRIIKKKGLEKQIKITGYITDQNKIRDLQSKGAIGVAPYLDLKEGSSKPYGDVIKIRAYFVSGLVVITTPVPPVAKEIKEEKLGYVTKNDSSKELAQTINLFLGDKKLLFECRKNVLKKARKSSWEKNYTNTLQKMNLKIEAN